MVQPLICLILTGKTLEEDVQLAKKYEKLVDVVELRVDYLNEEEQLHVRKFPSMIMQPCILTIRRTIDGGLFSGGEFSRTQLFGRALAFANPDKSKNFAYVDFEDDYHIPSMQDAAMAFGVRIIRSYHNLKGPVRNLKARCDSMRKTGYEIPKICFQPKSLSDLVNVFNEGQMMTQYDHILQTIGPEGQPSRILATFTNSYLTYVSPEDKIPEEGERGQLDPYTLLNMYNFRKLTKNTQLYGICGWPMKKPASPTLINSGFNKNEINSVFVPIRSELISEALNFAEQTNFKGLSISVPFKESVLFYVQDQSPEVMQIGACDTLIRRYDRWFGYNTECIAFEKSLLEFTGPLRLRRQKVAIIGAGGTAKAAAYVLKQHGARVCIFNRSVENGQQLADRYGFDYCPLNANYVAKLDEYSTLIIQTTTVGMNATGPATSENDPISFYNFRGNEMVFDVIYTPSITPVMKRAAIAGCKTCNGYKMLEYQTYEQFKLFTGQDYN